MKAYIELKDGFWTINGKRNNLTFKEREAMSEFFKIVKRDKKTPDKYSASIENTKNVGCNPFSWFMRFFRKKPKNPIYLINTNKNFTTIKSV